MFSAPSLPSTSLITILLIVGSAFFIGLATPSVAAADQDYTEAEQLFIEGQKLFRQGDNIRAAEFFVRSYEIAQLPELLYNIAHAYRLGDELALAEKYYQKYLHQASAPPNEEDVIETIAEIQELRASRMATFTMNTDPSGATISVDNIDRSSCQSPCILELDPGSYQLRAELTDHITQHQNIDLETGQTLSLSLPLEPQTAYGHLHIQTDADGAILLTGGQTYRLSTHTSVELEQGPQNIIIAWQGERFERIVEITGDGHTHIFLPLHTASTKKFSPLRSTAFLLGGASLALAAAATLTGLQANNTYERLEIQYQNSSSPHADLIHLGKRQKTATNMLWAGTALTFSASAGLFLWDMMKSSSSSNPDRLEPTVDKNLDKKAPPKP